MAYNTSKGPRNLGDIANETDTDTQIDFGSDSITLKTNNVERLSISNSEVSSSVHFVASSLSASQHISGAAFYGDGSTLSNLPASGISWDGSTANGVATYKDSDEATVESNLTFDGSTLTVSGTSIIDKNHSTTDADTITGLEIDFDKTGASTSNNTMYGVKVDMDNTTATDGANYMYGLHVTPTLTHAADAGDSLVFGAFINAQGGTNGTGVAQAARFEAAGGDINFGIVIDCEDGGTDLRIESSADNGDYFQIQTTTHGATTITTSDDNAAAAHLTFNVDGDITFDPVGDIVSIDGILGVGTGSPAAVLHVTGSGIGAGTQEELLRVDGDAGTGHLFVSGSGHVGIGTLEPNASLTVSGTSPNLRVQDSDTNYAFTIDGTSAGGMMWHIGDMDSSQDSFMTMGAYSGMNRLDTAGRDFHLYGTNTPTGFYFDESLGTFGFGTTSPGKTVTVAGQISASVEISASAFYGDGANLTNLPSNSTGSGDPGGIQFLTSTDGSFMSDGALSFSTGSSGASGTALSCSNLVVGYGLKLPYGVKTSNYSVAISDNIIYMSGSFVNVTASLPAASTVDGSVFYIKNISAHREAEVRPNGSELIDNAALQTLDSTEGIRIQALAAGGGLYTWAIIGVSMPLP